MNHEHKSWLLLVCVIGVSAGLLSRSCRSEQAEAAPQVCHAPLRGEQLMVTPADTAFAKETCKRRNLAWSRIELSLDGSKLEVYCESDEVVRAQTAARFHETGRDRHPN